MLFFLSLHRKTRVGIVLLLVVAIALGIFTFSGGNATTSSPSTVVSDACRTSQVTIQRAGAPVTVVGTTYESISVTNRSRTACTLPVAISARAYDIATHRNVGEDAVLRGTAGGTLRLPGYGESVVQLGDTSSATINGCNARSVSAMQFSLGDGSWEVVADDVSVCQKIANLDVSPFSLLQKSGDATTK